MSKSKLIEQLKKRNSKLNNSQLESIVNIFLDCIKDSLSKGNSVEIRGFGRWFLKKLKENHNARNPATNKLIYKPERIKIRFKASKNLNKIINE